MTTSPPAPAAWTCPTCQTAVQSAYCPACGESRTGPWRLSLRELSGDAFKAVSSLDSKLMRSLRALLLHPGALTAAYAAGRRKLYIGPLSLFLGANAAFFAVQSASKTPIFAAPLSSHLTAQDWSPLANLLAQRRLEENGMTLAAYSPLFDQAAVLNAKALVILMPLVFAFVPALLFVRRRTPLALHAVFALHVYTALLLLFCLVLGASDVSMALGGAGLQAPAFDHVASLVLLAAFVTYLYAAAGPVYDRRPAARAIVSVVLASSAALLLAGYRFAIFLITLATT
jgi:hypothetical protein